MSAREDRPTCRALTDRLALPGPERRIFALMGTRGQVVLVDSQTHLVIVQTAVRKNFVEPWFELFALMRGALRYVAPK